jgi:hypothetical protein
MLECDDKDGPFYALLPFWVGQIDGTTTVGRYLKYNIHDWENSDVMVVFFCLRTSADPQSSSLKQHHNHVNGNHKRKLLTHLDSQCNQKRKCYPGSFFFN